MDDAEAALIADALVTGLKRGAWPPDEAVAWTRYVCEALRHRRDLTAPDPAPLTYRLPLLG